MRITDKLLGPRRDDPKVREFVAASTAMHADPDNDDAEERFVKATRALPLSVAKQLRAEGA